MKRFIGFSLALCLAFSGCKKDDDPVWTQVKLEDSELTEWRVSPSVESTSLHISGGSGEYSAVIDAPEIADVRVEPTYGAGILLIIEPKAEGDAVVTVTDTKSGLFARCQLRVTTMVSFRISHIFTHIDADTPEAIEADLAANTPWVEGGGMVLMSQETPLPGGGTRSSIRFVDADNKAIADGTLTMKGNAVWSPAFDFLPINDQIQTSKGWTFECDGETWESNLYVVSGSFTRAYLFFGHYRLYDDLTEHYRTKYPEAGVRSVVRVLISSGSK